MDLGHDIGLEMVESLAETMIVSKFMHMLISLVLLIDWCTNDGMKTFLGYIPFVNALFKGWVCFIVLKREESRE